MALAISARNIDMSFSIEFGGTLGRAGRERHQPVEAERDAARWRHDGECREKIVIDRILLAVAALPLRHRFLEAAALFAGVGDFGKAVGELDAAGVELEALGEARVAGALRPRRFGQ